MLTATDIPDHPFTTSQAREAGITAAALRSATRDGVLRRVLRGVYVRADAPDSVETRATAAALVVSARTVLVDRSAAWLHGVDVLSWHETEVLPPLETYALRNNARPRRAGVLGGVRDLAPGDVVELNGVLVTTPLRTAVDLACLLPARDGLAALDAFMRLHGLEQSDMRRLLVRYFRRRGVIQARWLCQRADGRAESPGESWVRYEMLHRGLPEPTLQHWVNVDGVPTYRLDLAYPRHRIAIEYDGAEFHTEPADRQRDGERREWLAAHGWTVIVVDRERMGELEVDQWIAEIRLALAPRRRRTAFSRVYC